jgi:hypothetical protein
MTVFKSKDTHATYITVIAQKCVKRKFGDIKLSGNVGNYQSACHNIQEKIGLHQHQCNNLKARTEIQ